MASQAHRAASTETGCPPAPARLPRKDRAAFETDGDSSESTSPGPGAARPAPSREYSARRMAGAWPPLQTATPIRQSTRRPIVVSSASLIPDPGTRAAVFDGQSRREGAQPCGVLECRLGSEIPCHAPLGQHDQTRAERQRKVDVVGDGHAGRSAVRLGAQDAEALQLLIDVEKCRGLVEQQQTRSLCQTGREKHPLALAA